MINTSINEQLGRIAVIGGGKMGEAIVSGLVQGAMFDPESVIVADTSEERREYLEATYAISTVADGAQIRDVTTVILAVKPQCLREVAEGLAAAGGFDPRRVVSIAAGITTATLREYFDCAVVRVMPNAPLMVASGMSAVCVAEGTPHSEGELVVNLFSLMGDAVLLDETLINAATAINGSGPAYFALLCEELADAGVRAGLSEEVAARLALQTLVGTGRNLELTGMTPAELRVAVTSPGGTTQAALDAFFAGGLREVVDSAVQAAVRRAEELA